GLSEHGQIENILPLVAQVYTGAGADRAEALAVVGMELHRLGNKKLAEKAFDELKPIYDGKKRPPLRSAVVAFFMLMEKPAPKVGDEKDLSEGEAELIGQAEGHARRGQLQEARAAASKAAEAGGGQLRALIALAAGAVETKPGDSTDLDTAL